MAHHGDNPFDAARKKHFDDVMRRHSGNEPMPELKADPDMSREERQNALSRALLDVTGFKGALGTHSQGKLTPSDEGDVQFRVGSENGKVVLDFGSPVAWVGMDAQQAADLASSLLKWARIVGRKEGVSIAINLNAP